MELRWYQHDACRAAWDFLCAKTGNPVICLPTGSGKSLVIADICRSAIERFGGRVLVLAHRKELLSQNAEKIRKVNAGLDVGIYSAGLDSSDTDHGVVVAGIQSVFKRAGDFGQRHLVLIDEVHLCPCDGKGMYRRFLDNMRGANPHLRMVGLTATPYRLDAGPICRPDALFQKVCYSAPIRQLIAEGWLCNLTTKAAQATVDTSRLHLRGGEFVAAEADGLFSSTVGPACQEIVEKTKDRKTVIVFCSGVHHASLVAAELVKLTGEQVGVVTGETLDIERGRVLSQFKAGRLRWLCNVDVLTTGFDAPNIDAIAVLRATMSPGLFAQIVGRGFRVDPSKRDCLILDFGGNIKRHGPIDSPEYGVQDKRQKTAGEAPTKNCPNCESESLIGARECGECGFMFQMEREARHDAQAAEDSILSEPEVWLVDEIGYAVHTKRKAEPGDVPTLRVDYRCHKEGQDGNLSQETISEWVCLEHDGYAGKKAARWWVARSVAPVPSSIEDAVDLARRGALSDVRSISAAKQGRWWRVMSADLDAKPTMWTEYADGFDPFEVEDTEEVPF
jgi:DNA repair protein RadD